MSLVLPSVQAREGNRVEWQTQWWCSYVFAHKPRLKGYSTPKWTFCHLSLTPCRSEPVKASFVFRTQFKIFWMKTGRPCLSLSHTRAHTHRFWDFSLCNFRDLIYAQSACNTPKRKENLKSHHMTFNKFSNNSLLRFQFNSSLFV